MEAAKVHDHHFACDHHNQNLFKPHIGKKEDANPYLVANKYLVSGYRINYDTWSATICSLFQWHNETVNIWTHFVGFIVCLVSVLIMSFAKVIDEQT